MHFAAILATVSTVLATASAQTCPSVWEDVGVALRDAFFDNETAQCNDLARGAIRAAFHDCAAWETSVGFTGGCDGSLILANEAFDRVENNGLQNISTFYSNFITGFSGIGMADLLQFGASAAIKTCPLGPTVTTFVGRTDWTTSDPPAPTGLLPSPFSNATVLLALFADKGISAAQLAALVGAHSTSRQFFVDTADAGQPQDDTPGIWDVDFYTDVSTQPAGTFTFPSDVALMNDPTSGPTFKKFVGNQAGWNGAFVKAMGVLSLLGRDGSSDLIDCTASLPISSAVTTSDKKRGFSFLSARFDALPLKREEYQNYHKW